MRLRIGEDRPAGEDGGELTARFADWLVRDRTVGRHVTVTRERSGGAAAGGMSGGLLEWLGLSLGSGFSAAGLVYAHLSFRASLRPRERAGARMTVEHEGVRIVIEDGSAEDVARLARLLGGTAADRHLPGSGPADRPGEDAGGGVGGSAGGAS